MRMWLKNVTFLANNTFKYVSPDFHIKAGRLQFGPPHSRPLDISSRALWFFSGNQTSPSISVFLPKPYKSISTALGWGRKRKFNMNRRQVSTLRNVVLQKSIEQTVILAIELISVNNSKTQMSLCCNLSVDLNLNFLLWHFPACCPVRFQYKNRLLWFRKHRLLA